MDDQQQDNELIITTMNNNNMNPHLIINSGNNNGNIIHGLDTKLNYLTSVSNRINERFQTRMTMLSNNNNDNIHQLNPNSNHGIIMNHYPNHYNSHSSSSIMNGHHNHHHQHHNHHQYPFTQSADTAPRKLLPLKRIT